MAKYTTELRSICEQLSGVGHGGYGKMNQVITDAIPKIFDFTFPIFDEAYRTPLERKILMHYYTREIGMETYGLWKMRLNVKLNEIMPYYNQLYQSEKIKFDPMHNTKLTTTNNTKRNTDEMEVKNGTTNRETTTNGADYDLYSATPQGGLQGVDSEEYLTEATKYVKGSGADEDVTEKINTDRNIDTTEDYVSEIVGKQSGESFSQLLQQFRDTFLNIDMMVIRDLEELFMGVW